MATAAALNPVTTRVGPLGLRLLAAAALLLAWQALAMSGLLFRDVVPTLPALGRGLLGVVADPAFWRDAGVTAAELGGAVLAGGSAGLLAGLLLGGSPFLGAAFERWVAWLSPTPKIILFPVLILLFGVGSGSKVAMGAVSCFFPVALTTAAALRGVDPVLLRVARSFRARPHQVALKVFLPAAAAPLLNGLRLGFGIALIGVLLAETKLSNQGVGFQVMQAYARFDMPRMYGLLIGAVGFAALVNIGLARLARRTGGVALRAAGQTAPRKE